MLVVALASHLAVAAYIFAMPPATSSGGGGKVIGTMSIALGGTPAPQPAPAEVNEAVVEEVQAPVPEPVTRKAIAPAPAKPKPPQKPARPKAQPRPPVVTPPRIQALPDVEPVNQMAKPAPLTSDAPADSALATTASNATPTLGEGASAAVPGIGGSTSSPTQSYDAYLAMIRARIEAKRTYPASARRSGQEGTTSVRLLIGSNGNLTSTQVIRSSGHFALDRAAKRMVQKAAPFPAPPDATFEVTVPIAFALR